MKPSESSITDIFINPEAGRRTASHAKDESVHVADKKGKAVDFHRSLPEFQQTRLAPLHAVAKELGLQSLYVKDESSRLGLPSFKILGASWGTICALQSKLFGDEHPDGATVNYKAVGERAREAGIRLVTATDGNHGRAVARMANLLGITSLVYVPAILDAPTIEILRQEATSVTKVDGDYDATVTHAAEVANSDSSGKSVLIQDTSFEGYERVPEWIVSGYSTLLDEIDSALMADPPTHIIIPVGVGSLAHSVVQHYRLPPLAVDPPPVIIAVEPTNAACLFAYLSSNGGTTSVSTQRTVMAGMNCGSVSPSARQDLRAGVSACVRVRDEESIAAMRTLAEAGVRAGPCGAAPLAALRKLACTADKSEKGEAGSETTLWQSLGLGEKARVVLLCTEGEREFEMP